MEIKSHKFASFLWPCLILFMDSSVANDSPAGNPPTGETTMLDSGHNYIASQGNNLADWMDGFFGDANAEAEAAHSTLRLRLEEEWEEHNNEFDSKVKVRGKVYLPRLNKKLSLIFSEDDSDDSRNDLLIERDASNEAFLQYNVSENNRHRIDFRLGLKSSLGTKTSVRYRYEKPIDESLTGTFSEEVFYIQGDGFVSDTRLKFDKLISKNKLIQWNNKIKWEEDSTGFRWVSGLAWDKRLTSKKAYGYLMSVRGETEPSRRIYEYSLGMRYKQNIFRKWLFAEIQPSYRWYKPEPGDSWEEGLLILFRLEAVFTRSRDKSIIP